MLPVACRERESPGEKGTSAPSAPINKEARAGAFARPGRGRAPARPQTCNAVKRRREPGTSQNNLRRLA